MKYRSGMDPRSVRCDPRGDTFFVQAPGGSANRSLTRLQLIEQANSEASERVKRLRIANSTGTVKRQMGVQRTEDEWVLEREAERRRVADLTSITPCRSCGVRSDHHAEFGCRRLVL